MVAEVLTFMEFLILPGQTCTTDETETTTTTCPSDETPETGSVDCPSDYCATSEAQSLTTCSFPDNSCTSSESVCRCGFNQRRTAPGGSCISVYDCRKFLTFESRHI